MKYDEFMNKPLRIKRRIQHQASDVAFKMEICMKTTTHFGEKVQASQDNSTEKCLHTYIDAKAELESLLDEYRLAEETVKSFLYDNLDFEDADLLEWRYIDNKPLSDIADLLGIAYQTCKNKMHDAEKIAKDKFSTRKY